VFLFASLVGAAVNTFCRFFPLSWQKQFAVAETQPCVLSYHAYWLVIWHCYVTDPTKYFGCELGAQTQFDNKNDRFIVNGAHTSDKLQDLLDGFIRKFVLCPECDNPETNLVCYALVSGNSVHNCYVMLQLSSH